MFHAGIAARTLLARGSTSGGILGFLALALFLADEVLVGGKIDRLDFQTLIAQLNVVLGGIGIGLLRTLARL